MAEMADTENQSMGGPEGLRATDHQNMDLPP